MGSGFKDWSPGDVLTAADVDGYLMRQTVMTFADASARDTALSGVLDEGMVAYLEDTNAITVYNGSAWVSVIDSDVLTVDTSNNRVGINDSTPSYPLDVTGDINATGDLRIGGTAIGEWTTFTPTLANCTTTSIDAVYAKINKVVHVNIRLNIASVTGTVLITMPSTMSKVQIGFAEMSDASPVDSVAGLALGWSATQIFLRPLLTSGTYAQLTTNQTATVPFTWASGDVIRVVLTYVEA